MKLIALLIAAVFVLLLAWHYRRLQISRYQISIKNLPDALENLRIAHVSDLHGHSGENVLIALEKEKPDLIAVTGDVFDGVQDPAKALHFLRRCVNIAPCYMVSGNHELYRKDWPIQKENLNNTGVIYLENETAVYRKNGADLEIAGIAEPALAYRSPRSKRTAVLREYENLIPLQKHTRILLMHRGDMTEDLVKTKADLLLCGHLHGGHWRFFGRGVFCPNDGDGVSFFPKHSAGVHFQQEMQVEISRGLGDCMKVPRLFNRPELVTITLQRNQGRK